MSIHLRFVREADPISDIIAWFSQGVYSHVDCILPAGTALGSRSDVIPKGYHIPAGVEIRPPNYAKFAVSLTLALSTTKDKEETFYKFLYSQVGKPYDRRGIFGIALGRDWRDSSSWFCSEIQAAGLEEAGIIPRLITPTNRINPDRLATVVSAIGGWIVEELPVDNKTILTKK